MSRPTLPALTSPSETDAGTPGSPVMRTFQLLEFLAEHAGTGARIPEICEHLAIHRVSVHRLLRMLMTMGYVEQAADLSYHLGFEVWALGIAATRHFVPQRVAEVAAQISATTGESVVVMRRAGLEGVCIAFHEGSMPIKFINMRVGSRRPLGIGGLSVAILSSLPPDQVRAIIGKNGAAYRSYGMSPEHVQVLVDLARRQGYAYSEGIIVPESRTLAAPIPLAGLGQPTNMSMSILTTQSRLREPRRTQLAEMLKQEVSLLAPPQRREVTPAKRRPAASRR